MTTDAPATETELKLRVPPEALRGLKSHPLLSGGEPSTARTLHTVYYDTPDCELWKKGVALRVRRDGQRWLQAVKADGTALGALHQRTEIETEIAGAAPDLSRITDERLVAARARLQPLFSTRFRRRTWLIRLQDTVVEASIDRGEIRGNNAVDPISELELELKSGPAARLFEMGLQLVGALPLQIETRSKAERGYALAQGAPPAPVRAKPSALVFDMTVRDAFKAVVWATLHHLQCNEPGMLEGGDPEYLHQMRVALRRLRSAFSVFGTALPKTAVKPLTTELKWLARALAPARDWDVFMTETLTVIEEEFSGHAALAALKRECQRRQRRAHRRAQRAVASCRYQTLMLRLTAWLVVEGWLRQADIRAQAALMEPAGTFAATVLEGRYERVRKRGRGLKDHSAAELHELRIAVKKLRYAGDFFAALFDAERTRGMLSQLARLQTILGTLNDAATVEQLLRARSGTRAEQALSEGRSIVLAWSRGRASALMRELRSAWKAFRGAEKFWSPS